MTEAQRLLAQLRDPRLAPHLVSAVAAWMWAADGSRVLWANAAGAVALGAATPAALIGRRFAATDPTAAAVRRLSTTLARSGPARLERVRGFGGPLGRPLACACSRLTLDDGTSAILMVAAEPPLRPLRLVERVMPLLTGCADPVAAYAPDGSLIHATASAVERLDGTTSLGTIGADALAGTALDAGAACGDSTTGRLRVERFGSRADTVLIATWADTAEAGHGPPDPAAGGAAAAADRGAAIGNEPGEPPAPGGEARHPAEPREPPSWRRQPLRFVWQMAADGTFTLGSNAFAEAVGPRTAALLGRPWREIAADLALDPGGHVAAAVASHETWSGIVVGWPVDATGERAAVELSGLPVFDHDRTFRGYRGFGVCRDVVRLSPHHEPLAADAGDDEPEQGRPEAGGRPAVAGAEPRPVLTVVPAAKNVVPFRSAGGPAPDKRPALTPVERPALREVGKASDPAGEDGPPARTPPVMPAIEHHGGAPIASGGAAVAPIAAPNDRPATSGAIDPELYEIAIPSAYAPRIEQRHQEAPAGAEAADRQAIVDRLPVAVLVYRADRLIFASPALLDWTGWADLAEIAAAGGLEVLFTGRDQALPETADGTGRTLALAHRRGDPLTVDARLFTVPWEDGPALALVLMRSAGGGVQAAAPPRPDDDIQELEAILETATDGVVRVERDGRIISLNRGAEALFGYDSDDLKGHPFIDLFAPESHRTALDYLDGLSLGGGVPDGGLEVVGRGLNGGQIPLFMTMGRIGEGGDRCCAVFRDMTRWKRVEQDLIGARRQAETASSAKSDFLARISHEIRTPLNAIIGFSEVMMEERFGPLGNDRYRGYLKDIHTSGGHLVSLINDLLDLSKIEAGKVELVFATVDLNTLVKECVALMQPQANRERIIIRISLSSSLPPIVADARSVRQIALNLLSNSIKFTRAGGQVIVSTALGDGGDAILRVRDTGVGMSEQEIATALEPFRQLATSTRWGSGGTGLGLPLTKALAESNGASFKIKSAVDAGTLVEITFRATGAPGR
ncbi:MAG: histidine kinase dimerization/phospho-acceptor domain-containing protein [Xanthobacteraceae bacterium]